MGRKPEDTALPHPALTPEKLFTLKQEEGPNGITLTAIWTGLDIEDARLIAEGAEGLVNFPDDFDPWSGEGVGDAFN